MKKLFYVLTALVAVAMVGCKDPDPDPTPGENKLSLEWNGEQVAADTIIAYEEFEYGEIVCNMCVRNNSETDLQVNLKKEAISEVEGSENYFCWGECYLPTVETSPASVNIAAGDITTIEQFAGHYIPNDLSGTTEIKYTFFVVDDETSQVSFTARYVYNPSK